MKKKVIPILISLLIICAYVIEYRPMVYIIASDSMSPVIRKGSLIVVVKKDQYSLYDVVTYKVSSKMDTYVTHRINRITDIEQAKMYYTKGDANKHEDFLPITQEEIIGKVYFVIPYFIYIFHPTLLLMFFYMPVGYLAGRLVKKIVLLSSYE